MESSTLIVSAANQRTCMANTICCTYSNCLLVMISHSIRSLYWTDYRNKLKKKSPSCWSLLSKYITMHGPQNVKQAVVQYCTVQLQCATSSRMLLNTALNFCSMHDSSYRKVCCSSCRVYIIVTQLSIKATSSRGTSQYQIS